MAFTALTVMSARIFGFLVGLPLSDGLQFMPKLCIALLCGAAFLSKNQSFVGNFAVVCMSEFFIGILVALPARCFVEIAAGIGETIDLSRGAMQGSIVDPLNGNLVSDLASILRLASTVLAINFGVLEAGFILIRDSFHLVKPGAFGLNAELAGEQLRSSLAIVEIVLGLGGRWMLAFLMVDLFVAILAKFSFGLSFSAVAVILKALVTGLLLFWLLGTDLGVRNVLARAIWAGVAP